jgi:hypothetical protein
VLRADDGRTMFFAHLQSGSIGVKAGQRVARGDHARPRRLDRLVERPAPALRDLDRRVAPPGRPPDRPAPAAARLGALSDRPALPFLAAAK